jgi:hypothetical protein
MALHFFRLSPLWRSGTDGTHPPAGGRDNSRSRVARRRRAGRDNPRRPRGAFPVEQDKRIADHPDRVEGAAERVLFARQGNLGVPERDPVHRLPVEVGGIGVAAFSVTSPAPVSAVSGRPLMWSSTALCASVPGHLRARLVERLAYVQPVWGTIENPILPNDAQWLAQNYPDIEAPPRASFWLPS